MTPSDKALAAFRAWYDALPRPKMAGGSPAKDSIAVGLIVLERLKTAFDLSLDSHLAAGDTQIHCAFGTAVKNIFAAAGETWPVLSEEGRTKRGTQAIAELLLNAMRSAGWETLQEDERQAALHETQRLLIKKARRFHTRERLKPVYDPAKSTRQFIHDLLELAGETRKGDTVARYLVGARLQLQVPTVEQWNESYSVADDLSGQRADFVVEDAAFHVTIVPTPDHLEKCKRNLHDGRRVFLLVPESVLLGARQNANLAAPGRIAVESIESLIANFVELKAQFSAAKVETLLSQLCEHFNAVVAKWAPDEWLTLEIIHVSDSPVPIFVDVI